tara:strand:+ start:201 stop:1976 length:1776 start_codon:yes stop_codon:yes gene_type:complete
MGQILEVKTIVETKSAEKNVEGLTNKIDESTEATEGMVGALDKMTGGAITAFKGVVSGVKKGIMAMKTFRTVMISTGIGALIVAVGTLITYFTSTQKGADMVDKAMAGIGATIDVLIDRMSTFGEGLMNIMTGNFSEGLDKLAGSFKGITAEIVAETAAAVILETSSQKLLKTKRAFTEQEAKLNADLEKYRLASENFDLSAAERLEANTKAQETAMELANQQMAIAKEELRILTEKNALGESMNEDLDAEAEAKAKLFQIEQGRDALAKEFQAKSKGITDEQKAASAAATSAAIADRKAKQDEADAKAIEDAKEAAAKIESTRLEAIKAIDNEIREYKLTHDDVKLADLQGFEERKRALELEQLNLSEASKEAIKLGYKEKDKAASDEFNADITAGKEEAAKEAAALDKFTADSKEALQSKEMAIASSTVGFLNQIAGKNKGLALAALAIEKGQAIAGVVINAGKEMAANNAMAAANPANITSGGLAGVAQAAALNSRTKINAALNIASITAAGISGAKSIASSGAGSGASTGAGGSNEDSPRIPNFEANNQGVGGRNSFGSMRAVVVNQDIKDSASLDSRVDDLIKIGK